MNMAICPQSLAFSTMDGGQSGNKQIVSPNLDLEEFKDLPKHDLGVAALADILKAEENLTLLMANHLTWPRIIVSPMHQAFGVNLNLLRPKTWPTSSFIISSSMKPNLRSWI
jgi:hypothetical protein